MELKQVLLTTAYLPNVQYISQVFKNDEVFIEAHENFVKQTYRNRCDILTSNGKLSLSIPLVKQADKEIITSKRISYAENWQQQHWRAITSAYKNSPYFEFFEDEFKPFYHQQYDYLFDFNLQLLKTVLHILRVKKTIHLTSEYQSKVSNYYDCRQLTEKTSENINVKPYYQQFAVKYGFTPNLSCIDLLFNEGLYALDYLI